MAILYVAIGVGVATLTSNVVVSFASGVRGGRLRRPLDYLAGVTMLDVVSEQQAEHDAELLRRRTWAAKVERARFFNRLRELFHYDPETGAWTRTVATHKGRWPAGCAVGSISKITGYVEMRIDGRLYLAHRLAFLFMTGIFPPHQIDHVNMDRADNRWINIRMATNGQNTCNRRARKDSASGIKGVYWNTQKGRWQADIVVNGKKHYLGRRKTREEAAALYAARVNEFHGEFSRVA